MTVNGESRWMIEATAGNVVTTFNQGELPLRNNQLGFWGGVGTLVRLNEKLDASIEVRYERTDGLVDTSKLRTYSSHTSNFQVVVALRINRAQ